MKNVDIIMFLLIILELQVFCLYKMYKEIKRRKNEEKKIPEKLNLDNDELRGKETPRAIDYLIEDKINQVIDYLKSKETGE